MYYIVTCHVDSKQTTAMCIEIGWPDSYKVVPEIMADLWHEHMTISRTFSHYVQMLTNDPACSAC